jgi:hypothetical protein
MGMGDMETAFQSALTFNQQRPGSSTSGQNYQPQKPQQGSAWMGDYDKFSAQSQGQGKGKGREVEVEFQPRYQNQNQGPAMGMGSGYYPSGMGMGMGMGMMHSNLDPGMGMTMCLGGSYGQQTIHQPQYRQGHVQGQGLGEDLFDEKDLERAFEEVEKETRLEGAEGKQEGEEEVQVKGKGGDFEAWVLHVVLACLSSNNSHPYRKRR